MNFSCNSSVSSVLSYSGSYIFYETGDVDPYFTNVSCMYDDRCFFSRPAVSLKAENVIIEGIGTQEKPYIIRWFSRDLDL